MKNIFDSIPENLDEEVFDRIVQSDHVKIEPLLSNGHTSPESGWHVQDRNEWVLVVQGEAVITFEDGREFRRIGEISGPLGLGPSSDNGRSGRLKAGLELG